MREKSVANYQIMLAASTSQTNMLVKRDEAPFEDANPVMKVPIYVHRN